ncbi:hypothetical protein [Methylotuvimicrobium alcaliphilum]|uniref:Lipoprotein n=1 Tax=Methylotuvimicrobium alcaliphilum (strain DSM 19304 / NCIMB 14124 / VKM B-2133 / 20Z) TaxID=1091494 RepID=G4T4B4_META2|nr:hypothetical protein [Methylotuvimicrobium alcaliphilum]CCE24925.1 conserved exported protein of unknown function [Methylotuvimicrobium alcaliphilum 20Z]
MSKNKSVIMAVWAVALSACGGGGEDSGMSQVKSAFLDSCIQKEGRARPVEQARSYCNCVTDSVFGNRDISDETKRLMFTMSDKDSQLYKKDDAAMVRGALMACYTSNFYKKK